MKKLFLSDTLFGLVVSLVVLGGYFTGAPALETLELKFYDFRTQFKQDITPPDEVRIIAIDDDSIAKLGRWPWPRSRIGAMVELLHGHGAKVIGLNILFSEADRNPALSELDALAERYRTLVSSKVLVEKDPSAVWKPLPAGSSSQLLTEIASAKEKLDEDKKLAAALAGKPVVLPMFFNVGTGLGGKPDPLPPEAARSTMTVAPTAWDPYIEGEKATVPLPAFAAGAAGIGHINLLPDIDGTVRRATLAVRYGKDYYPAYAVEALRVYLGLEPGETTIHPGLKVKLGKIEAPVDPNAMMNITWRGPERTFFYYSFFDVLNEKVKAEQFKDKIVLIGLTATGVGSLYVTPAATNFPGVEITSNIIENLLNRKFLTVPEWAFQAEAGALAFFALFVTFVLPRLRAAAGAILSFLLLAGVLAGGTWLFVERNEWVKVTYPAALLAFGYIVIVTKRFLFTERSKELVEASQIETNKMLGLSFQGQGMLDLAFQKFQAAPLDEKLAELLYNLGLDFERKRQYNKAVSVYEYIGTQFPKFKDIPTKIENLKKAADGAVFGGSVGKSKDATILTEGAGTKPTLGRYEVEKELGRGAMGIVYLGRDPKINRMVAIKTMSIEDDLSEEALKDLKERFFREAESAGNLNHPNIVRIFDAGEEHEVCYIAMELLKGHDLKRYCEKDKLLPLETLLDYFAKAADALDYAHSQGVVHRDIKPANIMLLEDGTIRVADFGIARITASSKTATGTVMGTPSYMSPEQVAGKKVDGRADIWSLGVSLYEMSSGQKPFKGGDAIGTLLFQIANDPHPPVSQAKPDLPSDLVETIDRCLVKDPEKRYEKAGDLARDLRKVLDRIRSGGAPPPPSPAAAAPKAAPSAPAASGDDKTLKPVAAGEIETFAKAEEPKAGGWPPKKEEAGGWPQKKDEPAKEPPKAAAAPQAPQGPRSPAEGAAAPQAPPSPWGARPEAKPDYDPPKAGAWGAVPKPAKPEGPSEKTPLPGELMAKAPPEKAEEKTPVPGELKAAPRADAAPPAAKAPPSPAPKGPEKTLEVKDEPKAGGFSIERGPTRGTGAAAPAPAAEKKEPPKAEPKSIQLPAGKDSESTLTIERGPQRGAAGAAPPPPAKPPGLEPSKLPPPPPREAAAAPPSKPEPAKAPPPAKAAAPQAPQGAPAEPPKPAAAAPTDGKAAPPQKAGSGKPEDEKSRKIRAFESTLPIIKDEE